MRLLLGACFVLSTVLFSSCKKDDTPVTTNTITDIVLTNNDFTLLRAAVQRAGLADALRGGSLTVFAPTDAAFRAAGYADVAAINAASVASLTSLLQYHVVGSRITAANIPAAQNTAVPSLLTTNGTLYVSKVGSNVSVNGRRVTTADVAADNGIVHVIDGVLIPPSGDVVAAVIGNPQNFSLLAQAVQRAGAGVITALQSTTAATVFAPTNQAFIDAGLSATAINATDPAVLARVLSYHVVPGRVFSTLLTDGVTPATLLGPTVRVNVSSAGVTVTGQGNGTNAATVVSANNLTSNAVIHGINRVLLPPP
ncbi:fasciclin domain-containing protein [Fibrella aestuarina]|uniref:Fasciclin domain-containing protein n=2 Tax=Fibrivirga algicola TaxID=2950420 RepID=A0ABX0QFA0_9BACT|nr:fasciclin domain-containing protein [Fibrivirga algicola]